MNKQKILIIAVVVLVILNVTTLSLLWFSKPGRQHHRSRRKQPDVDHFLKRKLDLSNEQAEIFKSIREEHFESTHDIQHSLREDRQQLSRILSSEDTALQNELMRKISNKNAAVERLNFRHLQNLKTVCNEEQKVKFDSVILRIIDNGVGFRKNKKTHKKRK